MEMTELLTELPETIQEEKAPRAPAGSSCPYCGTTHISRRSRLRFYDLPLLVLFVRPVRCVDCYARYYRFISFVSRRRRSYGA